jgi:peptide chain release factor subunit 1
MDRKEATIGQLVGKRIEMLQNMSSGIPSKVRAGGQSSQRFHRITEGLTKDFYKRIANEMKNFFLEDKKLKGIIVGGPIPTKDEFLDNEYLPTPLQIKVIGRVDIGNTDASGLDELVQKSQDILANQEIIKEKKLLEKFFNTLGSKPDLAAYKEDTIRKALQYGAVDLLLLSTSLDKTLARDLRTLAENISSNVEVVSTETTEGDQFKQLSGMGAILRFKV